MLARSPRPRKPLRTRVLGSHHGHEHPADTYALSDDHVAFRDAIRQIVRERVAPRAAEIDAKAEYPWDLRKLFAEQDLLGLPFEEEHGGTGTGTLMLNIASRRSRRRAPRPR